MGEAVVFASFFLCGFLFARIFFVLLCAILNFYFGSRLKPNRDIEPSYEENSGRKPANVVAVIPAHNEENVIGQCINAILNSRRPVARILVVDDGSLDQTSAVVQRFQYESPQVDLIKLKNNIGKVRALNKGLGTCNEKYVLLVDADTFLEDNVVDLLLEACATTRSVAAASRVEIASRKLGAVIGAQRFEYATLLHPERWVQGLFFAITTVPGATCIWDRSYLQSIGGIPDTTFAEDSDLTLRAQLDGRKIVVVPEAIVYTLGPNTLPGLILQRVRWFVGNAQCASKYATFPLSTKNLKFSGFVFPWFFLTNVIVPFASIMACWIILYYMVTGYYLWIFVGVPLSLFVIGLLAYSMQVDGSFSPMNLLDFLSYLLLAPFVVLLSTLLGGWQFLACLKGVRSLSWRKVR